jgi:hypothetical protein
VDQVMDDEDSGGADLPLHQKLRLNLSRLAHVEFADSEESHNWRAAPPVLAVARTPAGFRGILCGARSLDLLHNFRTASANLRAENMTLATCPDVMCVSSATIADLDRVAQVAGIHIQHEAAASLLSVLDPIDRMRLGPSQDMPFGKDVSVERFAAERHRYRWEQVESGGRPNLDGLYRYTRWQQPEHYLRSGGKFVPVAGQIGKFVILNAMKRNVLRYDRRNWSLRIPAICRPPALIDRALHLCSGMLPEEAVAAKRGLVLIYQNVPPGVANLAAELLGQKLT